MVKDTLSQSSYWAIRSVKEPDKFLPGYEGRGHTHHEPQPWWIINPRLFTTKAGASRALGFWLKGRWELMRYIDIETGYADEAGMRCKPAPERSKEDFEVVEINMRVKPAIVPAT